MNNTTNYQVLARKWRPHCFADIVGQEHAVTALSNALNQQRLHHAYLLTGSAGVGKTTIARIIAKSLNCEQGVQAIACGTCDHCQAIDAGCFADLIEVDAASRTKVEDTRELLENIHYAPSLGRYKVYLIDEVHMLSNHSFNALLKTLEEPPEHVKFILATTDPQKLPVTVLSRCLQFHLKNLSVEQIQHRLVEILQAENIPYEEPALTWLAQAAGGSLRDALSLLDQAIAYGGEKVYIAATRQMLGCVEKNYIYQLLQHIMLQQAPALFETIASLADVTHDYAQVLQDILSFLHHIAVAQAIGQVPSVYHNEAEMLQQFVSGLSAETVQLYYQIALIGQRDLLLAPTPRSGFEMVLLRMLSFAPLTEDTVITVTKDTRENKLNPPTNIVPPTTVVDKLVAEVPSPSTMGGDVATLAWHTLIPQLNLSGLALSLASHCQMKSFVDQHLILMLSPQHAPLLSDNQQQRLKQAIEKSLKQTIKLTIQIEKLTAETPAVIQQREQQQRLTSAVQNLQADPHIQMLQQTFDATLLENSIQLNPVSKV